MFFPHSNAWLNSKFEFYKELRSMDRAYYSSDYDMYILTRHKDVLYAFANPDIFSSAKGNLIVENPHRFGRTLGASDGQLHAEYKSIVKEAYSKSNTDRIVSTLVKYTALEFYNKDTVILSDAINRIAAYTVASIINLPCDIEVVKNMILDIQNTTPHALKDGVSRQAHDNFTSFITKLLNSDILPTGPGIYYEYYKAGKPNVMSLFTGPTISGVSSLIGALQFLILDLFRTNNVDKLITNRELVPSAVLESLRYNSSTGRFSRTITKPIHMHGVDLEPGTRVALCIESANRDPDAFTHPDKFLLDRESSNINLAFGYGVHSCIALAISKSCMTAFLNTFLDYFGKYTFITDLNKLSYVITASGNDDMISNLIIKKL